MSGRIAMPPVAEDRSRRSLPLEWVSRLLDSLEKSLIVADRSGSPLLINARARHFLEAQGFKERDEPDRKSTRLNSSHSQISYAVFCLKKKKHTRHAVDSTSADSSSA